MKREINKENRRENELIFCSFVPVGLEDYVTYFVKNFSSVVYLRWKFPHGKREMKSVLVEYENENKTREEEILTLPTWNNKFLYFLFLPFDYIFYFCQSLFFLWQRKSDKSRIFFGVNYICAFCGIMLKKLGRVDFVVYRVMDFFPLPPSGFYRILNRLFYIVDKFCLENADSVWFTTKGHIIGREKRGYFKRESCNYQMIPLAVDLNKFLSREINEANKHSLVYCGVVSRYHMLDLIFEVIYDLKKEFFDIKFNLIGSGPDVDYFKDLAQKKDLQGNIIFHGFMEEDQKFRDLMADNALGVALYRDEENFMKYTEPAKVKYYLNFGVPVLISDVPVIAKEIEKEKVGFSVKNNKEEIKEKIKVFFSNSEMQKEYRENIKKFIESVDVNKLLESRFEETFK